MLLIICIKVIFNPKGIKTNQALSEEISRLIKHKQLIQAYNILEPQDILDEKVEASLIRETCTQCYLCSKNLIRKFISKRAVICASNYILLCLIYVEIHDYRAAIDLLLNVIDNTLFTTADRAKFYFLLGSLYEKLKLPKSRSKRCFIKGSKIDNSLYAMLCSIKTTPHRLHGISTSQYKPVTEACGNDYIFFRLRQCATLGKDKEFVEYLYSITTENFKSPSIALVGLFEILSKLNNKRYIIQLWLLMYIKTGVFIREYCFLPQDIIEFYTSNLLSLKDILLCFALISQESKFYSFNLLSNKGAMGSMQIMPNEARKICQQLKIPYNPDLIKHNFTYNILFCMVHFRECAKYVGNNTLLSCLYYHSGHDIATNLYNVLRDTGYLNSDIGIMMSIEFITTPIAKQYVHNALCVFIISHLCCTNKVLDIKELFHI